MQFFLDLKLIVVEIIHKFLWELWNGKINFHVTTNMTFMSCGSQLVGRSNIMLGFWRNSSSRSTRITPTYWKCCFVVLSEMVKVWVLKFGMRVTLGIKSEKWSHSNQKVPKIRECGATILKIWHVKEIRSAVWRFEILYY